MPGWALTSTRDGALSERRDELLNRCTKPGHLIVSHETIAKRKV